MFSWYNFLNIYIYIKKRTTKDLNRRKKYTDQKGCRDDFGENSSSGDVSDVASFISSCLGQRCGFLRCTVASRG
ncbi:hypothetical protein Hanom_Chr07g00656741 [Helianthus anomalus]